MITSLALSFLIILANYLHLVRSVKLSVRDSKLGLKSLVVELGCRILLESELLSCLSCCHLLIHLGESTAGSELDGLREILIKVDRLIILLSSWLLLVLCCLIGGSSITKRADLTESILDASVMNARLSGIHGAHQPRLKAHLGQFLVLQQQLAVAGLTQGEWLVYFHLLWGFSLGRLFLLPATLWKWHIFDHT